MAVNPKSLKNLKHVQKGQILNPEGGRAMNPLVKALRRLTLDSYREVIELALDSNVDALKALVANKETPAIQVGIATSLLRAISKG